jgi:hypothetical protein
MKSRIVAVSALLTCGGLLSGGCASVQQDLLATGDVSIRAESTENLRYSNIRITREATTTTIAGRVGLNDAAEYQNMASHIDVALLDENESPIFVAYVPYMRAVTHGHANLAKFSVSANMQVPDRAVVSLNHHAAPVFQHD